VADEEWERLPSMPTPLGGLGASIAGGELIAVGGETPTKVLGTVESYDIASKTWAPAEPIRPGRHGMTVVAVGETIYALGGALEPGHANSTKTAEALTVASATR
jgi:non-specific serine/threonine protein kinase